jgi:hypothetical protein
MTGFEMKVASGSGVSTAAPATARVSATSRVMAGNPLTAPDARMAASVASDRRAMPKPLHFEPVAKGFLYKENTDEWRVVRAADGGDLLNHTEATRIFDDAWVTANHLPMAAVQNVRRDLRDLDDRGTAMLLDRLKQRRRDFRPQARQLMITKLIAGVVAHDQLKEGLRATTISRILSEAQLSTVALGGVGHDTERRQNVAGRLVRIVNVDATRVTAAPAYAGVRLPRTGTNNPQMAPSNAWMHGDSSATDTSPYAGPVGAHPQVRRFDNAGVMPAMSPSFAFDTQGNIITMRFQGGRTDLMKVDPHTLQVTATLELPARPTAKTAIKAFLHSGKAVDTIRAVFSDTSGGAYFYLDDRNRAIIPGADHSVLVVGSGANGFKLERRIDLPQMKGGLTGILPAWPEPGCTARHAWVASNEGSVGLINLDTGKVNTLAMPDGEKIENSFSSNANGAFIATNRALYRYERHGDALKLAWRAEYPTGGVSARQFNDGTGTTPTLMGKDNVVIVDGQSPMKLHVFSQKDGAKVASTEIFAGKQQKAVENSVIVHGNTIVVANSAGYRNPLESPEQSPPGGVEAMELQGNKLVKTWSNDGKWLTATPQLSANGLIYAYSGDFKDKKWDWALTGTDLRTGKEEYRLGLAEGTTNPAFDNAWASFSIGPTGLVGASWNGFFQVKDR